MCELMTIGDFATSTWLSPKALRLYDQRGLLSPVHVDPFTGYRKYSADQVDEARMITMLRRIDMSLEEIGEVLECPPEGRAEHVARFREREAVEHARRQSLAGYLERTMTRGTSDSSSHHDHPGDPAMSRMDVATGSVATTAFVSTTRFTSARELPAVIQSRAGDLFALAAERGGATGELVVIYHGQVGWESDGPVEVCVPLLDPDRAHRVEVAHEHLIVDVPEEDVQFPGILTAFDAVSHRARELGLPAAGPPREIYNHDGSGSMPRCRVALPVHHKGSSTAI